MATLAGSLMAYLQSKWALAAPGTAAIYWSEDWYNNRFPTKPQVTVTDLDSAKLQAFQSGGSLTFVYKPHYVVNVWYQIPRGTSGTAEAKAIESMRLEVSKAFRLGLGDAYGGSLTPFKTVLPINSGVPLHELDATPRVLRYEVTLEATMEN